MCRRESTALATGFRPNARLSVSIGPMHVQQFWFGLQDACPRSSTLLHVRCEGFKRRKLLPRGIYKTCYERGATKSHVLWRDSGCVSNPLICAQQASVELGRLRGKLEFMRLLGRLEFIRPLGKLAPRLCAANMASTRPVGPAVDRRAAATALGFQYEQFIHIADSVLSDATDAAGQT